MSVDILQAKIRKLKNPSMVSIAPSLDAIPPQILTAAFAAEGQTLRGAAAAYDAYCRGLLDVLQGTVPAIKLSTGRFFALGADGVSVLQGLCRYASEKKYYVALSLMRSDTEDTAAAIAESVFGSVKVGEASFRPYICDAVIVNGYLGGDSVRPYLRCCGEDEKDLFLLVKTHNKSGREVQNLLAGDRVIYTAMADLAMRWNGDEFGKNGYARIAVTAGVNEAQTLRQLREKYDRLFLLAEGYGEQPGSGKNAQYAFDRLGHGAVICDSGCVMQAWLRAQGDGTDCYPQALAAAQKMREDILRYVVVL